MKPAARATFLEWYNGKIETFGQRNNMDKTVILNNPKEFFELAIEPSNIVKAINMINDLMISLTYYQHDDFAELHHQNTTSYAWTLFNILAAEGTQT
uniref:Uncharacterized protein n=1 Tax=Romanomermis culicivorax TaxID=13658 RepID=A0A915KPC4_ROMCU